MFLTILAIIIAIVLLYGLIFGVIIFYFFHKKVNDEYIQKNPKERFYSNNICKDRALIIDTPRDSCITKFNIIENAKESLDISFFAVEKGSASKAFWSLLIRTADRGVKIRLVLDGVSNGVQFKQKDVMYALYKHPNIDLKFYEPIKISAILTPWVINNRLHDKYIICDNNLVILGGRNISDRFCNPITFKGSVTYDRDVVIYNKDTNDKSSGVAQIIHYFDSIYNSKYSKDAIVRLSKKKEKIADSKLEELRAFANDTLKEYKKYFKNINWEDVTYETNKVTLIHNPITRFNKEPWVWFEIARLMKSAKEKVFIQSPYVVLNKRVAKRIIDTEQEDKVDVAILTNSRSSTPNFPAYSSYLNYRKKLIKSGAKIYEFQSKDSIHAKSFSIDDDLTIIGSFNLDPRSVFLSTETMVVIHGKEIKNQFDSIIDLYLKQSLVVGEDGEYLVDDNKVEEVPIGRLKNGVLCVGGVCTRFVEYLL